MIGSSRDLEDNDGEDEVLDAVISADENNFNQQINSADPASFLNQDSADGHSFDLTRDRGSSILLDKNDPSYRQ